MYSKNKKKSAFSLHNKVKLIRGGSEYFNTLEKLIKEAAYAIQLQVYIFEDDYTGNKIADQLILASKKDIEVQVILDGYASNGLSKSFRSKLTDAGIKLRFFEPLFKNRKSYFGRRMHHKLFVVDGSKALVGGINISDRYNDLPGQSAWLDWAILIEGEASFELHTISNFFYAKKEKDKIILNNNLIMNQLNQDSNCPISIRRNDWVMNKSEISASYMKMLRNANDHVIMMSSYFIPGSFFKKNIIKALNRGVNIKVIVAGSSDIGISKYAEKYLYRWAIRHGLELYEYKHNILHGKIAVADGNFVTVGSYNINNISALASIELNIDVENIQFAKSTEDTLKNIIENDCERVRPIDVLKNQNTIKQILQWFSYQLFRIVLTLFTFYFKKKRKNQYNG
jgi:cardiolipin synthase